MILSIIGGASGVGKTSLLKRFANIKQLNTGDLFKSLMVLENRDEIRKGNWSLFENDVVLNMTKIVSESILFGQNLIIDTHFAVKTADEEYCIGFKESFLHQFGQDISKLNPTEKISINIILVSINQHSLFHRCQSDKARNREVGLADCFNDLQSNNIYSQHFFSVLKMATKNSQSVHEINHHTIDNEILDYAQKQLIEIIGER